VLPAFGTLLLLGSFLDMAPRTIRIWGLAFCVVFVFSGFAGDTRKHARWHSQPAVLSLTFGRDEDIQDNGSANWGQSRRGKE